MNAQSTPDRTGAVIAPLRVDFANLINGELVTGKDGLT